MPRQQRRKSIPDRVIMQLMVRAGGRCEFPGCNEVLWRDGLTFAEINNAYVAHIIADSPDGPRGDPILSPKLAADFCNLMLLCGAHHNLIDRKPVDFPSDLLHRFKEEHEKRIEYLTSLEEGFKTHLLFFGAPIGIQAPTITFEEVRTIVLPRYPAEPGAIEIDLTTSSPRDHEPGYFQGMQEEVTRRVRYQVKGRIGVQAINHLSVFALASIPLLIHFGREISNLMPTDLYEHHRDTCSWRWQRLPEENLEYLVQGPNLLEQGGIKTVALNLSLSGIIHEEEIARAVEAPYSLYTMTIPNPYPGYLKAREQLDLFAAKMRILLNSLRKVHGPDCEIHLFPAVPASVAVKLGQILLPKVDPLLYVYENNRQYGGFRYALTVPGRNHE